MNIEEYREYCLSKRGVTEDFPFDNVTLVFKVAGKMFALADIVGFTSVNLKCYPDLIRPGWHMSKKHWNTVSIEGDVPDALFFELIDHSYDLVVASLTKKMRDELQAG